MSLKKEPRYIGIGSTGAFLKFNLDPDIYKTDINTALGIVVQAPTTAGTEVIPYTLALGKRSTSVAMVKMKMEREVGGETESRRIELVCDRENADTAKAALVGKTVNIGPANSAWTLRA